MLRFLWLISLLVPSPLLSEQAISPPKPDEGKIQTSGKFEPKAEPRPSGVPAKKEIEGEFRVKELDKNRVQIGEVIVNRKKRSVSFPAEVEVRDQNLEYLLVHEKGKVHEALLSTKVSPQDVHLAVLLLAANGKSPKIDLSWRKNGPDALKSLSSLILAKEGSPKLTAGAWHYTGSSFDSRGFIAQREGSFIALIADPAALISHKLASGLGRDDVYSPNTKLLPAKGVPVQVILTF